MQREVKRFEKALKLLLDLHVMIEEGNDETEECDAIRDKMDVYWGWGSGINANDILSDEEVKILDMVCVALNGVSNKNENV